MTKTCCRFAGETIEFVVAVPRLDDIIIGHVDVAFNPEKNKKCDGGRQTIISPK